MLDPVRYRVELTAPHEHLFSVEAHFPLGGGSVQLRLPVWTPGSYLVREFERHVQEVQCDDGDGHEPQEEQRSGGNLIAHRVGWHRSSWASCGA